MGSHKANSRVSSIRPATREWSDLRTRQMVEASKEEERTVRFRGISSDEGLCEHDHETLEEAWKCSGAVVVIDEFNQVWSLYQAHKWGLINVEPIKLYVASKLYEFDLDEE